MTLLLALLLAQNGVSVTNRTVDRAIAVRCVTASGSAYESCAGAGGEGEGGGGGQVTQGTGADGGWAWNVSGQVSVSNLPASQAVTGTFWPATQPVSLASAPSTPVTGTFWQATQPVSGTFFQATQPVSGTVTANVGTGTQPVSGTFWQATQPVSGPATDAQMRAAPIPVSGTVTANVGTGTMPVSGTVNVGNATLAVTQSGTWTERVVGSAGAAFDSANNAAPPANVLAVGLEAIGQGSQPTAATAGNERRQLASLEGVAFTQEGSSNRFSCFVQAVSVMTQCQAAPAAGLRAYVTGFYATNQAATVQTLDVVYGTGSNCATAPTALTPKFQMGTLATTSSPFALSLPFSTPLVPVAANALCIRPSAATAFGGTLTGWVGP